MTSFPTRDVQDGDPTGTDSDQTLADSDQTLGDTDHTSSDADQTSADDDQAASDMDQAASDRDLAAGVDPRGYGITRDIRQRTSQQRLLTAQARLESARQRDEIAMTRDLAAAARDHAAGARDLAMAQYEALHRDDAGRPVSGAEVVMRAAEQRKRAAEHREMAAEHRALAARDRRDAAADRLEAAEERARALADRESFAAELALAETDALTGARTRGAGLAELDREITRCRRTGQSLVVAFVDVVGLKGLNDSLGHAAGDDLLRQVAETIGTQLRPYDLLMRLGGDEFLCAISNMSEAQVRARFSIISTLLAATPEDAALSTGFATLGDGDTVDILIARADDELVKTPRGQRLSR